MRPFYSTSKVCGSNASIKALIYSDMTNVSSYGPDRLPPAPGYPPSFVDSGKVYSIAFEKYTGEVRKDSATDQGGDYDQHIATVYVPRSRSEIELLLQIMRNRLLLVIAIDRYDNQHILYNARRSFHHGTGAKPGTRHGYEISFQSASDYLLPAIAGNGDIETAPPDPGEELDTDNPDCCITINPVNIAYTPAPSGNASNHNELVRTANDTLYFIDKNGLSTIINRPAPRRTLIQVAEGETSMVINLPVGFPCPDPDDYAGPVYDTITEMSIRIWLKLGSRWLQYGHEEGFTVTDAATGEITCETSIDGAAIEVFVYQSIPPTPL